MEDFSFSFRIFPRIIPDKLHGFKNKWANVSTTLSDRKNCYPTKYVVSPLYIYIWLGSFNAVSSITGYLLGRTRSMEQYYRFARDHIDQINKNTSSFASLIPFYLSEIANFYAMSLFPYFVNDTILQNAFSKKFEEQAREGKLVKFGVSSRNRCVSSRKRPPSTNVHRFVPPVSLLHCSNKRFEIFFCSKLCSKLSPFHRFDVVRL